MPDDPPIQDPPPTDPPPADPPPTDPPPADPPPTDPKWYDNLSDDLKGSPALTRYKDLEAFAKGHIELEKKIGAGLRIPKADAEPKEWDSFFKMLGRPDNPEMYEIQPPEDLPWNEESEKRLKYQAYKMGLSPKQTQQLVDAYAEDVKAGMTAREQGFRETDEKLKGKYGNNYQRNMAIATRALKAIDKDESIKNFLEETGLGNHPALVEMFLDYGKRMVEDGLIPGDVDGIATREIALQKIKAMEADRNHPYHTSKKGDAVFEEFRSLYQIAYD